MDCVTVFNRSNFKSGDLFNRKYKIVVQVTKLSDFSSSCLKRFTSDTFLKTLKTEIKNEKNVIEVIIIEANFTIQQYINLDFHVRFFSSKCIHCDIGPVETLLMCQYFPDHLMLKISRSRADTNTRAYLFLKLLITSENKRFKNAN